MNKIFVALGFIALVITCTFAAREPLSLVFIIATFIIIGFGFGKIGEKAAFNSVLHRRRGVELYDSAPLVFWLYH